MSIFTNLKKDAEADLKQVEQKLETKEGRNWVKWGVYAMLLIIFLMIGSCVMQSIFAPRRLAQPLDYAPQQQVAQPIVQPVVQNNPDPLVGVIAGMAIGTMMSNGMRYDGHNGYYHNGYSGPPRTIVVNKTTVINKTANPAVALANKTIEKNSPVITPADKAAAVKIKNPGDAAAEQARKQDALKAELKAKQAARATAPSKPSGFSSFSQKASSSYSPSRSVSSGGRR